MDDLALRFVEVAEAGAHQIVLHSDGSSKAGRPVQAPPRADTVAITNLADHEVEFQSLGVAGPWVRVGAGATIEVLGALAYGDPERGLGGLLDQAQNWALDIGR